MIAPRRCGFGRCFSLPRKGIVRVFLHLSELVRTIYLPQFGYNVVMNLIFLHHDTHHFLQAGEFCQSRIVCAPIKVSDISAWEIKS